MCIGMSYEGDVHSRNLNLERFELNYRNSRMVVLSDKNLRNEAQKELEKNYLLLEDYIRKEPFFMLSYEPFRVEADAPKIAMAMSNAAEKANVGPMASVAGAFSEIVMNSLLNRGARNAIVDNGGDISLTTTNEICVGIYAGSSPFSGKIALRIKPELTPLGICTSSGSVGHSISLGNSDAVVVVAKSTPLADAAATSIGNVVKGKNAIMKGIKGAKRIKHISGVIIIKGKEIGVYGKLPEIIKL